MTLFAITGGAGFIGSHLADALLTAGYRVRVLDDFSTGRRDNLDPRVEVIEGDVADAACVRRALEGAAGCFHLAAVASVVRGHEDWLGTHRTNQTGTITVLDTARRLGRLPVVYASSAAVYGDLGDRVAEEECRPAPLSAYGADKLGSELHAAVAARVHGVPTLGLRFFNVYGPRQDPSSPYSGVISIFARRIAEGETVTVHGDGAQVRDFVYVADVVAHLRAAMRRLRAEGLEGAARAEVLNVCTGRATSVLDLARLLGRLNGRTPEILHGPARTGDIRRSLGAPARAAALLGVAAQTPLDEGLAATLRSFSPVSEAA